MCGKFSVLYPCQYNFMYDLTSRDFLSYLPLLSEVNHITPLAYFDICLLHALQKKSCAWFPCIFFILRFFNQTHSTPFPSQIGSHKWWLIIIFSFGNNYIFNTGLTINDKNVEVLGYYYYKWINEGCYCIRDSEIIFC